MRLVRKYEEAGIDAKSIEDVVERILGLIGDDEEIEGLIGYSEGAMVAASVCCYETNRFAQIGIPKRIKVRLSPPPLHTPH